MRTRTSVLGLDAHIMACWSEAAHFDAIVLLEDDTVVAPNFMHQVQAACSTFAGDPNCAAMALHHFVRNETDLKEPFYPLTYHGWFRMQYPSSRGTIITYNQWKRYQQWKPSEASSRGHADIRLPPRVASWSNANWERPFLQYMLDQKAYVAYPEQATVTMFGELGGHVRYRQYYHAFHSRLNMETQFPRFSAGALERVPRYDPFFELDVEFFKLHNPGLSKYDFDVDLYGLKPNTALSKPYLLSSKPCHRPLEKFMDEMMPHEVGPLLDVHGAGISLGRTEDFPFSRNPRLTWKQRLRRWISR